MNILIDLGHPAHVHFFKNFIWEMEKKGHKIIVNTVNKEITLDLLEAYNIEYILYGKRSNNILGHFVELIKRDYQIFKIQKKYDIDIIVGIGDMFGAHISKLTKAKSIIFTDNYLITDKYMTHPWADTIITPTSFSHDLGEKQIEVPSFKELAYLHPDKYNANLDIYNFMNIKTTDKFVVVRFVAFKAHHDMNVSGFSEKDKIRLVMEISKYAKVFISCEGELPQELQDYVIKFPPEKIHDALYFADLLVTDSQTMTTEAAVLGTPAIRCNDWVGSDNEMLNFVELENKYNLIHNFSDPDLAIKKCCELLSNDNTKEIFRKRSGVLTSEKIDFTNFLVWFIDNYPQSLTDLKEHPEMQHAFASTKGGVS